MLEKLGITWLSDVQKAVMYENRRTMLVAGGERAGKSWVSGLFGASRTPYGRLFWIVGPDYALARPEFTYWVEHLIRLGAIDGQRSVSIPRIGSAQATTKTGQIIETKTADDVKKLAAMAPDGILMVEAAQHDLDSFLRCVGRVAQTRGWVLASGTFEGSLGWYAEKFTDWQNPENPDGGVSYSMPSWTNLTVYPKGRYDPEMIRLEQIYSRVEGLFEERCGAIPVPPATLIFREFKPSIHVTPVAEYDPQLPVYLAVDPSAGTNPYSVLACQFVPHIYMDRHPDPIDFCNVVDEVYRTGMIAEDIIEECKRRVWWPRVRGGAIDEEAPDDRKRWLTYGKVLLHREKVRQREGIRRLKSFLHYTRDPNSFEMIDWPHLRIHPSVKSLPYEFSKYKRDPAKDQDHEPREEPPGGQPDHSVKALWYLLIARYGAVKGQPSSGPVTNWRRKMK